MDEDVDANACPDCGAELHEGEDVSASGEKMTFALCFECGWMDGDDD